MRELRLMHYPIAVKYFFDKKELEDFKRDQPHYAPLKALTFCQAEVGARMEGLHRALEQDKRAVPMPSSSSAGKAWTKGK